MTWRQSDVPKWGSHSSLSHVLGSACLTVEGAAASSCHLYFSSELDEFKLHLMIQIKYWNVIEFLFGLFFLAQ